MQALQLFRNDATHEYNLQAQKKLCTFTPAKCPKFKSIIVCSN